ncbi:TetR/AcrR family transcriptional regulator [Paludibacterium purpuratum]|nr:TetR/AcrR family transcriptional regulator [Paludibacterium purpuratum]
MTPAQRLTDRKRAAILQAATAEFRDNGFDATSMDKIAARAEVSKRTVYNHFASKEALFTEILLQLWHSSQERMACDYRADQPVAAQLRALLQSKMALLADGNFMDLARVAIAETIHAPERAREMVARMDEREENIVGWIRAAQTDGKLKAVDPVFAANQLHALVKAFAFWPQITLGQPPLSDAMQRQVVDSAVTMFLAQYAVPESQAMHGF